MSNHISGFDRILSSWMSADTGVFRVKPGEHRQLGRKVIAPNQSPYTQGGRLHTTRACEPGPTELDLGFDLEVGNQTPGGGYDRLTLGRIAVKAQGGGLRLLALLTKTSDGWHCDLIAVNGDPRALHAKMPKRQVGPFLDGHDQSAS